MNVKRLPSVGFAIKTLSPEERRKVLFWFAHLENLECTHLAHAARPTVYKDVQALDTNDDIRIFFTVDPASHVITILDIAKPSRFETARPV